MLTGIVCVDGCVIVSRYVTQLREEQQLGGFDSFGGGPMPLQGAPYKYGRASQGSRASQEFLTGHGKEYPYVDAAHSYGNTGAV